jgi:hypothetical protein
MEKLFMSAGIIATIVLCVVGILKTPFKSFKEKHSKLYKSVFTLISIILAIGLSIVDEIYILCGSILSIDFAILICVVIAGVFFGYGGVYEGLGIKELVKKITANIKKLIEMSGHKKAVKYLNKIDDIDMAISFLEEKKHNQNSEV